jgi:hypothetical protein
MVEGRESIDFEREVLYQKANLLMEAFTDKFDHKNCPDLILIQLGTPGSSVEYNARGLKSQCEEYIRETTSKTIELLSKSV